MCVFVCHLRVSVVCASMCVGRRCVDHSVAVASAGGVRYLRDVHPGGGRGAHSRRRISGRGGGRCAQVCVCLFARTHTHTHTPAYIYTNTHTYSTHKYIAVHTHTHKHTRMHKHARTRIHTHTHAGRVRSRICYRRPSHPTKPQRY